MGEGAWRVLQRAKGGRHAAQGNGTPVITFDTHPNSLKEIKAFHLGADGYVAKPLLKEELLSIVTPWVERRRQAESHAKFFRVETMRRHSLEAEMKRLHDFTEKMSSKMPFSIIIVDAERRITYVNRHFCESMGRSSKELIAWKLEQIFPEHFYGPIGLIEKVETVLQGGHATSRFSLSYRGQDYAYRVLPISLAGKVTNGRQARHAMILLENVSGLKSLGEKVKLSEERYRILFEGSPDGVVIARPAGGRILVANHQAAVFFGIKKSQLRKRGLVNLFSLKQRQDLRKILASFHKKIIDLPDLSFPLAKGGERILSGTASPILHQGEEALLCIFKDVTDRRMLEDQVRQSERMAMLGQFTAGAAHEINNPMAIISSHAQYLLDKMMEEKWKASNREEVMQTLSLIDRESKYCGQIIKNLLAYTHRGGDSQKGAETPKKIVDILKVVEDSIKILERQLKLSNIVIEKHFEDSLPPILGDPLSLEHVFVNLIWNAHGAMPKGGKLKVSARQVPANGKIEILLQDTGVGIAKGNIQKLFTPFFTTKEVGKGTGLGLWVVQSIIKEHQGSIRVKSQEGKGSQFTIQLPVRKDLKRAMTEP